MEDGAVASDEESQRLRALRHLLVGAIEIVLKSDVFSEEIVAGDVDGG